MRRAPRMTNHQKSVQIQVQLGGPGLLEFNHNLGQEDLAFTRRRARELDAVKLPLKERQAQVAADKEAVEEEQRELERCTRLREEKKAEESRMIEGFKPILRLDEFQSLPALQPTNKVLQQQLVWHQVVDGDDSLPTGLFTNAMKEKMKELVVGALKHQNQRVNTEPDIVMADGERLKIFPNSDQ